MQDNANNQAEVPENEAAEKTPEPTISENKPSKKVGLFLAVVVAAICAAGVIVAFTQNNKQTSNKAADTPKQAKKAADLPTIDGAKLVYATTGDPTKGPVELYYRAVDDGGSDILAYRMPSKIDLADHGTYKNSVFFVSYGSYASKKGPMVWYSKDSGKSYATIFEGTTPTSSGDLGGQITSARFSNDGSKIVIGYLESLGSKNVVKEIDVATKQTKDLFSIDFNGVFIEGYSPKKGQILYFTGCYNCDGNTRSTLYRRDLTTNVETVVFEDKVTIGETSAVTSDLSKAVLVRGTSGEFMGGGVPFTVKEVDLATKAVKTIATINDSVRVLAGYTDDTNQAYYTKGNELYTVAANSTPQLLFDAEKPIIAVYSVSKERVVVGAGEPEGFMLVNFMPKTKDILSLMSVRENIHIFGVVE